MKELGNHLPLGRACYKHMTAYERTHSKLKCKKPGLLPHDTKSFASVKIEIGHGEKMGYLRVTMEEYGNGLLEIWKVV